MPLCAVRLKDLPRVGGKAAHLGELIAAGLPVPSGFVITTDACRRFMESDPRIGDWLKSLEGCDARNPEALHAAAEEVRCQLSAVSFPGDVAEAIAAALADQPLRALAVRSSATVEDLPEASFAGQHDSFLNVLGRDAVLAAVKKCWLSLFSERAVSYRMRKGFSPARAQMAVIIQELIAADAAGVMFTADPAGGNSNSILIEAAFGMGEVVVQGKVSPDRIEVSRSRLRVFRRDTGVKRVQIVAAKDGVCEELLAEERARAPVLDDEMAAKLAGLGIEAERVLGGPIDIEWAVCEKKTWLLQARPVTPSHAGRHSSFEDQQVWTNANAGEVLPDVVTPMTWSLIRGCVHDLFNGLFRVCGIRLKQEQLFGLVAGRGYFNFNTACALARHVPGLGKRSVEKLFGGHQDALLALKRIKISEADLPQIEVRRWRAFTSAPKLVFGFLFYPRRYRSVAADKLRGQSADLTRIEARLFSDDELLERIRTSFTPGALVQMGVIEAVGLAAVYYSILFALCERWFGTEGHGIANRLLAGVGDMEDAAAGHELWRMAEQAAREPGIRNILLGERTFPAFVSKLEHCSNGAAFIARWNEFMQRHGHHTRGEIELSNPRWEECPDYILDMVRSYVDAVRAGHPDPVARQQALAIERVALARTCAARLRNPIKRAVFRLILSRAQQGARFRENIKSELVRWLTVLRRFLLELGRRLAARGRLANESDIFFLEIEELQRGSLWDPVTDLRARVAARRALHEKNLAITPPAVIVGRFDPDSFAPDAVDRGIKVFHGLGVSAGTATGRARVILRSDTQERMQPGEILVAPFTDPGWTPYFVAVAGIVMDMGGMLSHGSIVAREYGIPAVVNVGPATQIIRTGQWLEVDADRGVVKVLDTAPEVRSNRATVNAAS